MKFEYYNVDEEIIRIPISESYKDCITLIRSDRYRIVGKKESLCRLILNIMKPYSPSILFWFRLCAYKGYLFPFCRFMYVRACHRAQVDIPYSTKIGYGFYLGHNMCIVINGGTIIGNNVDVSQFLNIGTNKKSPAIIGNNVYIGPHVSIVENVKIGCSTTIGAGAVVVKNTPANSTVVGIPAKVIHYNNPGRYVENRYPLIHI